MQEFIDRHGLTFQNMNDQTGELFSHFGVPSQPAWVLVSANGVVNTYLGAMQESLLERAFTDAIEGS